MLSELFFVGEADGWREGSDVLWGSFEVRWGGEEVHGGLKD